MEEADMMDLDEYDLREFNYISPVRNQGSVRSCVGFATCFTVEYMFQKETGRQIVLSPQDVYENLIKSDTKDKEGLTLEAGFSWMKHNGCLLEETRPYRGTWVGGPMQNRQPLFYIDGYETVPYEQMRSYLRSRGPIAVGFQWLKEMDAIRDQIYHGPAFPAAWIAEAYNGHCLVVIGYGREEIWPGYYVDFWVVVNSYGEGWGANGFARINMDIRLPNGRRMIDHGVAPIMNVRRQDAPQLPIEMDFEVAGFNQRQRYSEKKAESIKDVEKPADEAPRKTGRK